MDINKTRLGRSYSGATGLISCLRQMFATFGVPATLSSDGGPEFNSQLPKPPTRLLSRLGGGRHRISSVAFPQSNGRAELAVKKAQRTPMDNLGLTGSLENDGLLRAMLQLRNTPDPDCNVSPAEVIFGRPTRHAFSFVNRCTKFDNPLIRPMWRYMLGRQRRMLCAHASRAHIMP